MLFLLKISSHLLIAFGQMRSSLSMGWLGDSCPCSGGKELFTKELWGLAHRYQQNWENTPGMEPEGAGPGMAGCEAGDDCYGTLADDSGFNVCRGHWEPDLIP